jgi:RNA polymerase sigma factor (sigma-70 family)
MWLTKKEKPESARRKQVRGGKRRVAASLEELFEALETPLLLYAHKLVGAPDISQDIVQEAFMKLHLHWEQVCEPKAWLYRTVHNLAVNHHRKGRRMVALESENGEQEVNNPVDSEPLPDEYIERMEAIGQTRLCLETLDERSRQLLKLKFEEDLSYREMSARLGISVSNVGYILHHTLKKLAEELEKAGVTI